MYLELNVKYKSLDSFKVDIPDFTILTGLNGAGKTQILQGILDNTLKVHKDSVEYYTHIRLFTSQSLAPNNSQPATREEVLSQEDSIRAVFSVYKLHRDEHRLHDYLLEMATIKQIASLRNKPVESLELDDFLFYARRVVKNDFFQQNFSLAVKTYLFQQELNNYKVFKNENLDTKLEVLTDEEFSKQFGEPPWEIINEVLALSRLDYYVEPPKNYDRDSSIIINLIRKSDNVSIMFQDLSSGEKIIMSLALALYNLKHPYQYEMPEVLLFDEVDASLHPSMTKQLLDVIQGLFVNERGIKVIMATHSPSTVALAAEESLFVVNKTGLKVEKTSKDEALRVLTSGVPSFSVNYQNRRQVFVESVNDVKFYEKLYNTLSPKLHKEVSLTFISSGDTKTDKNGMRISNCGQVEHIVTVLRNAGNNLVWGIIDRDKNNVDKAALRVLGSGNRYAIENYLFDPILLAALLVREKLISRESVGLLPHQTHVDFQTFSQEQLQHVVDTVCGILVQKNNESNDKASECHLINGKIVYVPDWYLNHHGHDLETLIVNAFNQLGEIKRGKEDTLKLEMIEKVIDEIPELLSNDVLELFLHIQQV